MIERELPLTYPVTLRFIDSSDAHGDFREITFVWGMLQPFEKRKERIGFAQPDGGNQRRRLVIRYLQEMDEEGGFYSNGTGFWVADEDMPEQEVLDTLYDGQPVIFTPVDPKTGNQFHWPNATGIRPVILEESMINR